MSPRRIATLSVLIALGVIAASCTPDQRPNDRKTVTLTAFQLYHSAPIVAAEQSAEIANGRNCLEEAGLLLSVLPRSKGPDIVDALVGNSAEFGTLANTPIVFQALQQSRLVIFATLMSSNSDIKLVAHRDAGISAPSDIRGKRIGYVGGTFGEIFLDRYLEKHRIPKDSVVLSSAGPPQLRDLFLARSLDAIIIWEPIVQDILADSAANRGNIVVDVDTSLYIGRIHLVAKPEVLAAQNDAARRLVRALICGEEILKAEPAESQRRLERWLDRQPGTLTGVFQPSAFHVDLDTAALRRELAAEAQWALASVFNGKGTIPPDFQPWIDPSVMSAVAPNRVRP